LTAPFDLVPFDPANEWHQAFVYDTFRHSTNHWPWSEMSRPRLQERLRRELGTPGTDTRIATPHDMPDSFLGWYSVRPPSTVVYAFTKYSARRQGVATAALLELGLLERNQDMERLMIGGVFWTAAAARIAQDIPALYFDTREAYDDVR
jgi:hypothetical protein